MTEEKVKGESTFKPCIGCPIRDACIKYERCWIAKAQKGWRERDRK